MQKNKHPFEKSKHDCTKKSIQWYYKQEHSHIEDFLTVIDVLDPHFHLLKRSKSTHSKISISEKEIG